ncbi:MAG: carbohydrate ABC transporter permease [Nitrososphaerota archaeon]|nr:carbohydrate ABC transporter permease [Candidatus Calditenuaceae archaeon]MDW8073470.1 carbohydrate ABC transporter permease [Nitrososphaerota archaeon]
MKISQKSVLKRRLKLFALAVVLLLVAILMIYPLAWTLITSFKTNRELFLDPWGLPTNITFENFNKAIERGNMDTAMLNSLIVSLGSIFLISVIAPMAAYATSRIEFRFRGVVTNLLIAGFFIAPHAVLVPLLVLLRDMGLVDTHLGLILSYVGWNLPFAILFMKAFFVSIPSSLQDSARVDGLSKYAMYWRIMLPLALPTILTVAIIMFIGIWNDFLFAFIFLRSPSNFTVPINLLNFTTGRYGSDYVAQSAAVLISALPTVILYLVFAERIRRGVAFMAFGR